MVGLSPLWTIVDAQLQCPVLGWSRQQCTLFGKATSRMMAGRNASALAAVVIDRGLGKKSKGDRAFGGGTPCCGAGRKERRTGAALRAALVRTSWSNWPYEAKESLRKQ